MGEFWRFPDRVTGQVPSLAVRPFLRAGTRLEGGVARSRVLASFMSACGREGLLSETKPQAWSTWFGVAAVWSCARLRAPLAAARCSPGEGGWGVLDRRPARRSQTCAALVGPAV